jgi:3-oxoacyl-[acyl-carrier-protein] synthase-3
LPQRQLFVADEKTIKEKIMYNSRIVACASCYPDAVVTNDDLSKIVETNDEWISSRTGIKERRVSTGQTTSQLCIAAGKSIIEKTGIDPLDIDLIIVATLTPDFATPNTACLVQGALGCDNALCFDVSAACSGFVYAMSIANKFIRSGEYKKVLVFGAEVLSKITDWTDRSTCVLFGDGGGGALLEATEEPCGVLAEDMHSKGKDAMSLTANEILPKNFKYTPEEEDRKYIAMDGRAIFSFATKNVRVSIKNVLEKAGLTIDDIKYIVPHQANYRIIEVLAKKLGAPEEKFYMNLEKYGNTSAGSIPLALGEMFEKGLLEKGDKIIISGFGGGLTWGSMLIQL